jgi:hypothetical protein
MVHSFEIDGLPVKTGDLVCTQDGGDTFIVGQFWRLIGRMIPGDVDHIAVYVGPGGRCVEAGAKARVIEFDTMGDSWDAARMLGQRGFEDRLYGVAYPLEGKGYDEEREKAVRESVAIYCLEQAKMRKPYNLNIFDSETEEAFYCSQLAYKAYLRHGIDFNTGRGVPGILLAEKIVFPQEVWESCVGRRPRER